MRLKQKTWVALLVFLAIGLADVGSGAVALADDSPPLICGSTEIGVPKNCEQAVPPLENGTTPGKEVRFSFEIQPPESGFSVTDGCSAGVMSGRSCILVVKFAPTKADASTAELVVRQTVGDGKPTQYKTYKLQGTGTKPKLGISTSSVQFDAQQIHTISEPKGVTLTNNSDDKIKIKSVKAHGDFAVNESEVLQTLESAGSFVMKVRFKPEAAGYQSGFLEIETEPDGGIRYVTLGGKAVVDACGRWSRCGVWSYCQRFRIWAVLVFAMLYWLVMVLERWNRIARPTRELLNAQITSLMKEMSYLPTEPANKDDKDWVPNTKEIIAKLQELLTAAQNLLGKWDEKKGRRKAALSTVLFWSRGEEITGWGYVHEVEVHMAAILDRATVAARLVTEVQKLRASKDDSLEALADKIAEVTKEGSPADLATRRALLAEALNANYDRGDTAFANLVSWQNKTSYLVAVGLALIFVLSAAFAEQSILLLLGVVGGFISRLSRTLERNDVPTDYGASWTTLFLSPIAGGLGAWAGVLLIELAAKWQVVGSAVSVKWDNPAADAPTLAIALLFGFSERLLDSVLDALEKKTLENKATATPSPQKPKEPATPGGGTGGNAPAKGNALPEATVGTPYDGKLSATGAPGATHWTREANAQLPEGLDFAPTGVISGTPAASAAGRTFTFRAKAGAPPADPVYEFSIRVKAGG